MAFVWKIFFSCFLFFALRESFNPKWGFLRLLTSVVSIERKVKY